MICDGRAVDGKYQRKMYNVAVAKGRTHWLIKFYYDEEGPANRRADNLITMYGAVIVIPPNTPKKGNNVKRRA